IWDILYEHCCYFSADSLSHAFEEEGFRILRTAPAFGGQYLQIEAESVDDPTTPMSHVEDHAALDTPLPATALAYFERQYNAMIGRWIHRLCRLEEQGQHAVVWGAGTKGVSFLNVLKTLDRIRYVVDINPRKVGCFIPCTGQEVVAPLALQDIQPNVVILMNRLYESEVRRTLGQLSLSAEIILAENP
ncbi:MAG TPA: hypothetical protein VE890_02190, partial [Thermoguttaceae bacterium]|nr:hypothetical protein [Thermoguttaceae bacterium]